MPRKLVGDHLLLEAFEVELALQRERELGLAPSKTSDQIVGQDLTAVGRRAQPRRGDHRCPVTVVVDPGDVAGADTDANSQLLVIVVATVLVGDAGLDGLGGDTGIGGAAEGREHAVAQCFHEHAAVVLDDLADHALVGHRDLVGPRVADPAPESRRLDNVAEQDRRRLAALSFVMSHGSPRWLRLRGWARRSRGCPGAARTPSGRSAADRSRIWRAARLDRPTA